MRASLLFLFAMSALCGGCNGKVIDGGVPSVGPVGQGEYCARYAEAMCAPVVDCCPHLDGASCRASYLARCNDQYTTIPGVAWDADAAGKCLGGIAALVHDCDVLPLADPLTRATIAACDGVAVGTIPEGGACTDFRACAIPPDAVARCDGGHCVVYRAGKVGEPCNVRGMSQPCVSGAACHGGACEALPAVGDACPDGNCPLGAYCDSKSTHCLSQKNTGDACTSPLECLSAECNASVCVPRSLTEYCKDMPGPH